MQMDRAHHRLSPGQSIGGRFNAMIDGITHQMNERIHQTLNNACVNFRLLAGRHQCDLLVRSPRDFSDGSAKSSERSPDRNHAGMRYLVSHQESQVLQLAHIIVRPVNRAVQLRQRLADIGRHFTNTPGQDIKVVILIKFKAAEITERRRALRRNRRRGVGRLLVGKRMLVGKGLHRLGQSGLEYQDLL